MTHGQRRKYVWVGSLLIENIASYSYEHTAISVNVGKCKFNEVIAGYSRLQLPPGSMMFSFRKQCKMA